MFDILFCFIESDEIHSKIFTIEDGCAIDDFVIKNNIASMLKKFDYNNYKIGVFGKIKKPDYIIKKDDRLELYEPIIIDPKVRRKNIASNN